MSKSTMVELVEELRKLPNSPEIDFMISEALAGEYHDYKNQKYVCGKIESSSRLRSLGYIELARRIESGEFDETCDAEDEQMLRKDLEKNMRPEDAVKMKKLLGLPVETH